MNKTFDIYEQEQKKLAKATDDSMDKARSSGVEVAYADGKIGYCISDSGNQFFNGYYPKKTELLENMREEARILYVAMTRAINNFIWFDNVDKTELNWGSILREL